MSDELAHGGLRNMQDLGGAAHGAIFDYRFEGFDLAQIDLSRHL
jgi:hypothetical protein